MIKRVHFTFSYKYSRALQVKANLIIASFKGLFTK